MGKSCVAALLLFTVLCINASNAQTSRIHELSFLIGSWEVREENEAKTWWEETDRTVIYILDSTYIELNSIAISSSGKQRSYKWYIHYNSKSDQFEMVSIFSNWYKIQYDRLSWDADSRRLTILSGSDPGSDDYHERKGELQFNEDFSAYEWKGVNKSGNPDDPSIWEYTERGRKK